MALNYQQSPLEGTEAQLNSEEIGDGVMLQRTEDHPWSLELQGEEESAYRILKSTV